MMLFVISLQQAFSRLIVIARSARRSNPENRVFLDCFPLLAMTMGTVLSPDFPHTF
jgi:hypothetical protein